MIAQFEGLRLKAYQCPAGVWTIGYGHTGDDVKEGDIITIGKAKRLLEEDTYKFRLAVERVVPQDLTYNQYDALTSLCYNIGIRAFTNSTLVDLLNSGNILAAALEFPKWSLVHGVRNKGLLRRRMVEAEHFLS
jgi:lysozyme